MSPIVVDRGEAAAQGGKAKSQPRLRAQHRHINFPSKNSGVNSMSRNSANPPALVHSTVCDQKIAKEFVGSYVSL